MYCDINKEELNYFEEFSWDKRSDLELDFKILCDFFEHTNVIVYRLNKDLYPVFTIRDIQFEKVELISKSTPITLIADIDGNQDVENKGKNYFINFVNIESQGENKTKDMNCTLDESFNITCNLNLEILEEIKYDNVYLLPYYLPLDYSYPTELIIKKEIKANKNESTPTPEEEEDTEEESVPEDSISKTTILVIVLSVIGGIIIFAILVVIISCLGKKKTDIEDAEKGSIGKLID